jgi:hypothetical protein
MKVINNKLDTLQQTTLPYKIVHLIIALESLAN